MNKTRCAVALLTVSLAIAAETAQAADELAKEGLQHLRAMQAAFRQVIGRVQPSMVAILLGERGTPGVAFQPKLDGRRLLLGRGPSTHSPTSADFLPGGFGSGIVVDERGLVVTCYHVVRDPSYPIWVMTAGDAASCYRARIHAADPRSDLAVLEILSPNPLKLIPITIGDGASVFPGQFVLALGNPFGTARPDGHVSASWGIVSNIHRQRKLGPSQSTLGSIPGRENDNPQGIHSLAGTLIQTDARLNMGCSGGALVNLDGKLIGITMALSAAYGIESPGGFAVPTDELTRRVIDTLRAGREMEYGFLGIILSPIDAQDALQSGNLPVQGVSVSRMVSQYLPACKAGLKERDIITHVNGKRIHSPDELILAVGSKPVGAVLDLEIVRGQQRQHLKVPLAKYPVDPEKIIATNKRPMHYGIRVDHLTTLLGNPSYRSRVDPTEPLGTYGVVVRDVDPGSPANEHGVQKKHIITHVNGKQIHTPDEFEQLVSKAQSPVRLTFFPDREVVIDQQSVKNARPPAKSKP